MNWKNPSTLGLHRSLMRKVHNQNLKKRSWVRWVVQQRQRCFHEFAEFSKTFFYNQDTKLLMDPNAMVSLFMVGCVGRKSPSWCNSCSWFAIRADLRMWMRTLARIVRLEFLWLAMKLWKLGIFVDGIYFRCKHFDTILFAGCVFTNISEKRPTHCIAVLEVSFLTLGSRRSH